MYLHFFKRVFDLIFALIALPFVLLIIIIVAPFIWFDDQGPIFYAGKRIGKNLNVERPLVLMDEGGKETDEVKEIYEF